MGTRGWMMSSHGGNAWEEIAVRVAGAGGGVHARRREERAWGDLLCVREERGRRARRGGGAGMRPRHMSTGF